MQSILNDLHIQINPWLVGAINGVIVAGLFFVIFVLGRPLVLLGLKKTINSFQSKPHDSMALTFFKILRRLVVLIGVDLVIEGLPLPEKLSLWISNSIFVLVAVMVAAALFDLADLLAEVLRIRAREFETLLTKLIKILVATITLMVVMRHFNYDIWHIMTALGVGTLAVGLAAQPTLANMIAGFTILIDRPFRHGDHISLASGDTGDVRHIGMRSTQIQNGDGNMLIVSNTELVNSRVINYSMPNEHFAQKVRFFFDQNSDLDVLKNLIQSCLSKVPGVVRDSGTVLAVAVNDWSVELNALYQVENYSQTGKVTDNIISAVMDEMKRQQIYFAVNPAASPENLTSFMPRPDHGRDQSSESAKLIFEKLDSRIEAS